MRFSAFIDKEFVHKIQNRTATNLEVPSGKHIIRFWYYVKKKPHDNVDSLILNLKPKEVKYVMIVQQERFFANRLLAVEITEDTANKYIPDLRFEMVKR